MTMDSTHVNTNTMHSMNSSDRHPSITMNFLDNTPLPLFGSRSGGQELMLREKQQHTSYRPLCETPTKIRPYQLSTRELAHQHFKRQQRKAMREQQRRLARSSSGTEEQESDDDEDMFSVFHWSAPRTHGGASIRSIRSCQSLACVSTASRVKSPFKNGK